MGINTSKTRSCGNNITHKSCVLGTKCLSWGRDDSTDNMTWGRNDPTFRKLSLKRKTSAFIVKNNFDRYRKSFLYKCLPIILNSEHNAIALCG